MSDGLKHIHEWHFVGKGQVLPFEELVTAYEFFCRTCGEVENLQPGEGSEYE